MRRKYNMYKKTNEKQISRKKSLCASVRNWLNEMEFT